MNRLRNFLINLLPTQTVSAHCDVPCGIYDPKASQVAAATVFKMTQILLELDKSGKTMDERNKFIRAVLTKEEHARKCKEEILILWTDYFKPEHLEKFPDLHNIFWQAAKLCSKTKQTIDEKVAKDLVAAVDSIADIFHKTQKDHKHS